MVLLVDNISARQKNGGSLFLQLDRKRARSAPIGFLETWYTSRSLWTLKLVTLLEFSERQFQPHELEEDFQSCSILVCVRER